MSHFTCIISNITGFGDSLNTMEQSFQLCLLLDGKNSLISPLLYFNWQTLYIRFHWFSSRGFNLLSFNDGMSENEDTFMNSTQF